MGETKRIARSFACVSSYSNFITYVFFFNQKVRWKKKHVDYWTWKAPKRNWGHACRLNGITRLMVQKSGDHQMRFVKIYPVFYIPGGFLAGVLNHQLRISPRWMCIFVKKEETPLPNLDLLVQMRKKSSQTRTIHGTGTFTYMLHLVDSDGKCR